PGKPGLDLAQLHHALQRFSLRGMHHVGRQLERRDVLFVVYHPRYLGGIEVIFIDEYAARPDAGSHRIGAHAHFLAFEVLRLPDSGIRPHHKAAMVETAHEKYGQRDVWSAAGTRDHIGGRRHLADVKFEIAHHAPEGADDGHHLNEVRFDALDRNHARFQRAGMAVIRDRNFEPRLISHVVFLVYG